MESFSKYLDPGIIHFMLFPETIQGEGPILETIETIAEDDFFHAIEISWIKDISVKREAARLLKESQLRVFYGAQPRLLTTGLDLNSFNQSIRREAVKTLKEGVDEALELGAEAIAFLSGKNVEEEKERAVELLIASIKEVCEYAESKSSTLGVVLEVFDFDIDKCCLIGPVAMAKDVAQRVKEEYSNFGLMVDLSHLPLTRETPYEVLTELKDHLVHIHIGNAVLNEEHPLYGDEHPRLGIEDGSNGIDELREFLQTLYDVGYLDGVRPKVVSFEVKPYGEESPHVLMASSKRALKRAWRNIDLLKE